MTGFRLHPEAFGDIDEIRAFIASDSPDAADRVVGEIFGAIRGLVESPQRGFRRPDLSGLRLRFVVVREYLIAYAPELRPLM